MMDKNKKGKIKISLRYSIYSIEKILICKGFFR